MATTALVRRAFLVALLATLACLVLPGGALAAGLGPAPVRCGGEDGGMAGGCYGTRAEVMDDTWLADLTVAPHVVHVGETITATVVPLRERVQWTWPVGDCAPSTPVCTFTATAATGGWTLLGMSFPSPYGVGVEQDFYAVLEDLYAISGYVRDGEGKGVPGVTVTAAGKKQARAATNVNDDVLGAVDRVPKPDKITKKAAEADWKAMEKLLERSDRWNDLPDSAKEKFGSWARGQLEKGYAKAKVLKRLDGVLDLLAKDRDAVVGHPVLKMTRKYVEILKAAEYPSFDLRLLVSFKTTSGMTGGHNTELTVEAAADDFPSYGVQVPRREDGEERLRAVAWPPTGGVIDPAGRMSKTGPYVLVDPSTVQVADGRVTLLRQDRLLGGPGAKLALLAAMGVIANPIAHDTPIIGGQFFGGVARTLTWKFDGAAS